jgi:hypothetical protein
MTTFHGKEQQERTPTTPWLGMGGDPVANGARFAFWQIALLYHPAFSARSSRCL